MQKCLKNGYAPFKKGSFMIFSPMKENLDREDGEWEIQQD